MWSWLVMVDVRDGDETATPRQSAAAAPKRVSGGLVLKAKKKKKRRVQSSSSTRRGQYAADPSSSSLSGVPSILSSIPAKNEEEQRGQKLAPEHDEFGDDGFEDDVDVPNDALLCLQTYTRAPSGGMSETCAYCPIFTNEREDGRGADLDGGNRGASTHAAPFLPKHLMLHLLNNAQSSENGASNNINTSMSSPIAHIEQQIKQLASSNRIRMLQLHGTAAAGSGGGAVGWKGDGNDDEDVAIMETSTYEAAAEMALQNYFRGESVTVRQAYRVEMIHSWLISIFLPYFAGKTWIASGALDAFHDDAVANSKKKNFSTNKINAKNQFTASQMKHMIKHLARAGLLLPRRGVGPGGGEGYWFSLPGLGKAAGSIVDGRASLLRRLRSSKYKEKKRAVLEHEIGRVKRNDGARKNRVEQAGKFVVLDLLAKGWVSVHATCVGDQFIRLAE